MRRLLTSLAAVVLLGGAVGCCKHVAGCCDCDCCGYGCCGDYGCFEACPSCACVDPPETIPHHGVPGGPVVPHHPGHAPLSFYPSQPTYPADHVAPAPRVAPNGI
jgi:hypothetical protein